MYDSLADSSYDTANIDKTTFTFTCSSTLLPPTPAPSSATSSSLSPNTATAWPSSHILHLSLLRYPIRIRLRSSCLNLYNIRTVSYAREYYRRPNETSSLINLKHRRCSCRGRTCSVDNLLGWTACIEIRRIGREVTTTT
ncbi:uncharacterized protein STEHIDRAFT_149594 [Stereum hirsutum FP-91666 SS1]|uniref:uncharacterized protein n=1 Tax=Stereum hirsutum (strain FP-91666) TaxID=721885 RepID=UPI000444A20A|nr:uncharacterized protein STEHIDRAFT_149594 [Stereum hirsutum FP-91666 SS1]EIM81781.1 hypothetical protein STEHIDRAFT_149594 [Stereum hirsutum FP-91666 SS1]